MTSPPTTLTAALVALYAYVYEVPPETVRSAARLRMQAMDASDRWVAAGCDRADPLLAQERRLLVASYSALRDAVDHGCRPPRSGLDGPASPGQHSLGRYRRRGVAGSGVA